MGYRPLRRRAFIRIGAAGALGLALAGKGRAPVVGAQTVRPTPEEALQRLMEGHRRYLAEQMAHPNQAAERRREVAAGQSPFAIVLGCSDSRVPPEVIFDAGLGDLFIVRVAGNVVDNAGLGSIEFAAAEFESPLIVVLGHSNCGAVKAAISAVQSGAEVEGAIGSLVDLIRPAVARARERPGDLLVNATRANVELSMTRILDSEPILATRERLGSLDIMGGVYDLESGVVDMFAT